MRSVRRSSLASALRWIAQSTISVHAVGGSRGHVGRVCTSNRTGDPGRTGPSTRTRPRSPAARPPAPLPRVQGPSPALGVASGRLVSRTDGTVVLSMAVFVLCLWRSAPIVMRYVKIVVIFLSVIAGGY